MPSPEPPKKKVVGMNKEELAAFFARLDVARAEREAVVDSWLVKAGHTIPPKKSQAQIDAEDAALFQEGPPNLGLGEAQQNNNRSLKAKFFPAKGLKASKARDVEEKAASAKRGLRVESSDEEEGRSGLGRAKKLRMSKRPDLADATSKANQPGQLTSVATTVTTTNSKARVKNGLFREALVEPIETPAQTSISAQALAGNPAADNVQNILSLARGCMVDAELNRKQLKKDRKRAKEEHCKAKQASVDHMEVDFQPRENREERHSERASEERRKLKQAAVDLMDIEHEPKTKTLKQAQNESKELKKLRKKSEDGEGEHVQRLAEKDAFTIASGPDQDGQVASKKPNLKHIDKMEHDLKDKSAFGEVVKEMAQTIQGQGTLSKEEKNRERKQRKREKKKRAMEAAKLNSS